MSRTFDGGWERRGRLGEGKGLPWDEFKCASIEFTHDGMVQRKRPDRGGSFTDEAGREELSKLSPAGVVDESGGEPGCDLA